MIFSSLTHFSTLAVISVNSQGLLHLRSFLLGGIEGNIE